MRIGLTTFYQSDNFKIANLYYLYMEHLEKNYFQVLIGVDLTNQPTVVINRITTNCRLFFGDII